MISRRNFFTIVTLMFALFFLCMGTNNLKDWLNDYTVNTYTDTAEDYPSKINMYIPESAASGEAAEEETDGGTEERALYASRDRVVLIGDEDGIYGKAAKEWALYTRRKIAGYGTLSSYEGEVEEGDWPEMLVIDSRCVDWEQEGEVEFLTQCVEQGTHLIFCNLPDVSIIKKDQQVRNLLGIQKVEAEEATAAGLHLYSGFLLGGERVYLPEEDKEKDNKTDITDREERIVFPGETDASGRPVFPWYLLASGTKAYMKGIPEDPSVDTEDYPVLIWRKSFGTAYVFAVNGGYMEGIEGIGLLSAMSAEMYPYEIYPVVNAQNMVFTGYPSLADENGAEMEQYYGRSVKDLFQEVIWPNIQAVLNKYQYKATCMLTPQFDYSDDAPPDKEQLEYYLKIFNEASAEIGLSGLSVSDTSLRRKLEEDGRFIEEAIGGYEFSSFYAGNLPEEDVETALETDLLSSVMTVVRDYEKGDVRIIDFLSEYVTSQRVFDIGLDYDYKSDFLVKCLETALGYLNISFDMERVAYPDGKEDVWEKVSITFGTTADTYGNTFRDFDRTTVSECDIRIRRFLALQYTDSRAGDTVQINISEADGSRWFVLRTHNEKIKELEGGSWKRLEKGAYLIEADSEEVVITLAPEDVRFYR